MNLPDEKVEQLAEAIWNASRADEGTISATGAKIVAKALRTMLTEWLTEAYERGVNDTFATDGALLRAREEGRAEAVECCASGRCEVCSPGYNWGRDG